MTTPLTSYAYMSCPPYNTAAGVCAAGLSCTIPYYFGLHSSEFPFKEFGSYMRVATLAVLVFNLFVGWTAVKFTNRTNCFLVRCMQAILCFTTGCVMVCFNLAFGVRSAAIVTCEDALATACLEIGRTCQVTGQVRAWMGALYLFGLAVALCAQSYMIFAMVQRAGLGLEFPKIEELVNSSRIELSALEGKSVSVDQPTVLPMSGYPQGKSPKLVVTTESSTGSRKVGPQPPGKRGGKK